MDSEDRPAPRDRPRRGSWTRVAPQLIAPVVLGALIGGVLAYQAGSTNNAVQPTPLGAVPSPTPSFGRPSAPAAQSASQPARPDASAGPPGR